jgi:hypothetical protein
MPPHCSLPEPAVVEFGEINLSLRSWRPLTVARKNHQMQSLTPLMFIHPSASGGDGTGTVGTRL